MTTLNTIVDENNKKIADWYITDLPKGFVIDFLTTNPVKCRAILKVVLAEMGTESEGKELCDDYDATYCEQRDCVGCEYNSGNN